MLRLTGGRRRFCDGISRRSFLEIGALGVGGLTLADLLRSEARAGIGSSPKAVINIYLGGGPPHQDIFDLKPQAPVEYRGEFQPIATNVPGIEICELMPELAQLADKFALVRALVGSAGQHSSYQTQSGYGQKELQGAGGHPSVGSVVSKLQSSPDAEAPPFVSFMGNVSPGYLGPAHKPYNPDGNARRNLSLGSISAERLGDRSQLLGALDRVRRDADSSGSMAALDAFAQRAIGVITSGRLADALDVSKEDPQIRERYSGGDKRRARDSERFLLARRLVEVGVRAVSFSWGGWDTHGQNFTKLRQQLPALDRGLAALIRDLDERNMLGDVSIVMWGEFGRTPKINGNAGRDHWPRVSQAFLAGGGMRTGQVIGATTARAEEALDRPVHMQEVIATLYHNLGIDTRKTQLVDNNGRPQYLAGHRAPIAELV